MQAYPLTFEPIFKRLIWGGRRLGEQLGKPIGEESDYAESWEIVDHGPDQSIVSNGPLAGQSLRQLILDHPSWLLGEALGVGQFPLLLKYLDCNRVLSVQVHPDDAYAAAMEIPDLGKTEAWYIVAAESASLVYAGLKQGVDRAALQAAIRMGEIEQHLHSFHPAAGDIVFIPAGTVHALGAGLLVAEIQQSSDTTFRLFDWNRVDADGNPRQLHLSQGLAVTDYDSGPVAVRRSDQSAQGMQTMVRCDKFVISVINRGSATIGGDNKFHVLTVPHGNASLHCGQSLTPLAAGQSVLLPAAIEPCRLSIANSGTVLSAHLPD